MDAQTKKIKQLMKYMKKEGILSLKVGDIELTISPEALLPASKPNLPIFPKGAELSEEEIAKMDEKELFDLATWSTRGRSN